MKRIMFTFLVGLVSVSLLSAKSSAGMMAKWKAKKEGDSTEVTKSYEEKVEDFKAKIPFDIAGSMDMYIQTNFWVKEQMMLSTGFLTKERILSS